MEMTKTNHFAFGAALMIALLFALLLAAKPAYASTFNVNLEGDASDANTTDGKCDMITSISGDQCTLRAAIEQANATDDADIINFNIPDDPNVPGNEVKTIRPNSQLPAISRPVTIDGYSQPGASKNTQAQGGTNAVSKIELDGSNTSNSDTISSGLSIIGGGGSGSVVKGLVVNRFGFYGIYIQDVPDVKVEGNFIGTDPLGVLDRGNGWGGVLTSGGSNNTIGGTTPEARNIISGNSGGDGVRIVTPAGVVGNNRVEGNLIGTRKDGIDLVSNGSGVRVYGSGNTIGGEPSGVGIVSAAANIIAFNVQDGVIVVGSSTGNRILVNSIFANFLGQGIDLGDDGITANDRRDRDEGSNNLQNFPVITSATHGFGDSTDIKGKLNSTPRKRFTIRFFATPPTSEEDQGKHFLGQTTVKTNRRGNASFNFLNDIFGVQAGWTITATATKEITGDTSEFSEPVPVRSGEQP